jgi:hypothetical protein
MFTSTMSRKINWMGGNLGRRAPKKLGFRHIHTKNSRNVVDNYVKLNFAVLTHFMICKFYPLIRN